MPAILQKTHDRALIVPYVLQILPLVEHELDTWRNQAAAIPDPKLRQQAQASIEKKRFHCQGGSFYALYAQDRRKDLVRFIVALQTISDYLDNLCDRVEGADERGFRTLHGAMVAAVDERFLLDDWYFDYPLQDDGGYLSGLVHASRQALTTFPGYADVRSELVHLAGLYSDLQVYKHMRRSLREEMLTEWHKRHSELAPDATWWEFAAATGSTLAIFALAAKAATGRIERFDADWLVARYFPWICGIHILLDYFIDLDEDKAHGDLNFVAYYSSEEAMAGGLERFLGQAYASAGELPRPAFHRNVVDGLLALYLSDPKANKPGRKKITRQLLHSGGAATTVFYNLCLLLRRKGIV